jgi:hypothetical protein
MWRTTIQDDCNSDFRKISSALRRWACERRPLQEHKGSSRTREVGPTHAIRLKMPASGTRETTKPHALKAVLRVQVHKAHFDSPAQIARSHSWLPVVKASLRRIFGHRDSSS